MTLHLLPRGLSRAVLLFGLALAAAGCSVGRGVESGQNLRAGETVAEHVDPDVDPYRAAEEFSRQGHFLEALQILDRLPTNHVDYAESRTLAAALERRIRTSHELILEGLELRRLRRDDEAIGRFRQALDIWSNVRAARGLIAATRSRMTLVDSPAGAPVGSPFSGTPQVGRTPADTESGEKSTAGMRVVTTTPVGSESIPVAAPLAETAPVIDPPGNADEPMQKRSRRANSLAELASGRTAAAAKSVGETSRGVASNTDPKKSTTTTEPNAATAPATRRGKPENTSPSAGLSVVQKMRRRKLLGEAAALLRDGNMDRATQMLEDLSREVPGDAAVASQLVRVLHQKALLAYGQGRLDTAVASWERIVKLDASHADAPAFLRAARTELERRGR